MRVGSALSSDRHALKPPRSSIADHQGATVTCDALGSLGIRDPVIRRALFAEVFRGRAPKTMATTLNPLCFGPLAHVAVRILWRVSEEMLEGERFRLPIVLVDVVGANGRAIDLTRLLKTIFDFSNFRNRVRRGRTRR
jgi:hypothetical protein